MMKQPCAYRINPICSWCEILFVYHWILFAAVVLRTFILYLLVFIQGFPGGFDGKESICNVGNQGLIPGLGRSSGEGNSNPFQDSCLENPWTEEPGRLQCMGQQRVGHN